MADLTRFEAHIRPAQSADMPACVEVYNQSLRDMQARHNFPPSPGQPPGETLAIYQHILETGIFYVSEVEGQIAGTACAILRGSWWFLSGFWVQPGMQHSGLGGPLLRKVWQAGRQAGASQFFVWSSVDLPAMATYLKLGMLPGYQILTFEGKALLPPEPPVGYALEPLGNDFASRADEHTLDVQRQADHEFWSQTGANGWQVRHQDELIGYFYLAGGLIGPAAWLDPVHAIPLLTMACQADALQGTSVRLRIPGMNHAALRFALGTGLQLIGYSHLLLTAPFGRLEQYLPSGPGLF
jgi:GNAT superfamily N-acetyltransferase